MLDGEPAMEEKAFQDNSHGSTIRQTITLLPITVFSRTWCFRR